MASQSNGIQSGVAGVQQTWRYAHPLAPRHFHCRCGQGVSFDCLQCPHCDAKLGYDPDRGHMQILEAASDGHWRAADAAPNAARYQRCANFDGAPQCNWLVPVQRRASHRLCRCCRLNRIVPDTRRMANRSLWKNTESAKRRLVALLLALQLPVESRVMENPEHGLAFDLMVGGHGFPPVMTGYLNGIVTIDVNEADDYSRESMHAAVGEPCRTVMGQLRHASGHYYWHRLIESSDLLVPFRLQFGDDTRHHGQALLEYHNKGPSHDWSARHVSAFASAHPLEDWAETWAHYFLMLDTLDTALDFGMARGSIGLLRQPPQASEPNRSAALPARKDHRAFAPFIEAWTELTGMLNELSLSMGLLAFYPCALSTVAVDKLHFVHGVMHTARRTPA